MEIPFDPSDVDPTLYLLQKSNPVAPARKPFFSSDGTPLFESYAFMLQMILWWSLWSLIEAIPASLGLSSGTYNELTIYLMDSLIGGFLFHFNSSKHSIPSRFTKIVRFVGLVFLCCGLWGLLDSTSLILVKFVRIPSFFLYLTILCIAALLGTLHHYRCQEDYLIDRLM
jgi:hypothetical protein